MTQEKGMIVTKSECEKIAGKIRQYIVSDLDPQERDVVCQGAVRACATKSPPRWGAVLVISTPAKGCDENLRLTTKLRRLVVNLHVYLHCESSGTAKMVEAYQSYEHEARVLYQKYSEKMTNWRFEDFFDWKGCAGNGHGVLLHFYVPIDWQNWENVASDQREIVSAVYAKLRSVYANLKLDGDSFRRILGAGAATIKIASKKRNVKDRGIDINSASLEKILRKFSNLGAAWIETFEGRKEPRARNWVRLRKVAGIEFVLILNKEGTALKCKGDVVSLGRYEDCVRKKMSKIGWNSSTVGDGRFAFSKERQGVLVGVAGEINVELLSLLRSDYESALQTLIQSDVFKEREDPLARQFESPEGCRAAIEQLKRSLVFAMSNGSHELFHTNVWAWLIRQDPVFAQVFFPEIKGAVEDVRREQGNRDLTIWINDNGKKRAYVVENKFKSYPRRDQLEGYKQKLGDQFSAGLLVVLNRPPDSFDNAGWAVKTQSEVCSSIREHIKYSNLATVIDGKTNESACLNSGLIHDYVAMTENLVSIMDSYSTALGKRWALSLDRNRGDTECGDSLESIRLQDIFKKCNAAKMVAYLEGCDDIKEIRKFLEDHYDNLRLEISHDFLHKLPVLNCEIVRRYDPAVPNKKIAIGVMLQGESFARCACSFDKKKYKGAMRLYDELRKKEIGWFDDDGFLVPGLRIVTRGKGYKQYVTDDYTVAYQDIGLANYSFESIHSEVVAQLNMIKGLLEEKELDSFFLPPALSTDQDTDED